jgi:HEAT repeat protein
MDWRKGLTDPDPIERRGAVKGIHAAGIQSPAQVPALQTALKDSDEEVQMWAALALINGKVYDRETIPILIRTLKHENATLRQVACLSLGLMPYRQADKDMVVPALAETAGKDLEEDVRSAALSALNVVAPELVGKSAAEQ